MVKFFSGDDWFTGNSRTGYLGDFEQLPWLISGHVINLGSPTQFSWFIFSSGFTSKKPIILFSIKNGIYLTVRQKESSEVREMISRLKNRLSLPCQNPTGWTLNKKNRKLQPEFSRLPRFFYSGG